MREIISKNTSHVRDVTDVEKYLAAGMNSHAGKPLNFTEVLEELRTYLPEEEAGIEKKN